MSKDPADIHIPGGVPLQPPAQAQASDSSADAGGAGGGFVIDVTEATFQSEVVDRSRTVPVVIDFWAEWCGPCKQLSPVLERLAAEAAGTWVLAKVDVDANPRLAQAFAVQGIPAVKAVVGGQLVDLFTGAMPESQVRQVLDQLRTIAAQLGVVGRAAPVTQSDEEEAPTAPAYDVEAQDAIDQGDLATARAIYEKAVAERPGDELARRGLAQVRFLGRVQELSDPEQARREADARPDDIAGQLLAADAEVCLGDVEQALTRLVDVVRRTSGEERDRVRKHLLELFDVLGGDDPLVVKARRALTSALF